jgi:hypothetical protein
MEDPMKTWHVLVPLLVLGSGAFYVKQQREQREQRAEVEQLRRETAALASSVNEREEQAPRRLVTQSLLRGLASAEHPPEPTAATAEKPAQSEASATPGGAPSAAEVAMRMQAAFSSEGPDRDWSEKTQQATQEKISAMMPNGSAVRSVDCRASLCRVEMSHEGVDDYRQFVRGAYLSPESGVWSGPTFTTVLERPAGGGLVAVSFLAREGESLPSVE